MCIGHVYKRDTEPGLSVGMICAQLNGSKQNMLWRLHLKTCSTLIMVRLGLIMEGSVANRPRFCRKFR